MKYTSVIADHFEEHHRVISRSYETLRIQLASLSLLISKSLTNGATLFWAGNGGSAADSQHLAAELVGRFGKDRRALRSIALTTDTSILTCVANDLSYQQIFSRQLEALARTGDILICISTSGNSDNIINALKTAKLMGIETVGLLGNSGGAAMSMVDHALVIPSSSTARIQESHILIGHILCDLIEKEVCP